MDAKLETVIEDWLAYATLELCDEAKARIRKEIEAHFFDAYHHEIEAGKSPDEACQQTLASLGDPREANRAYIRAYLTRSQEYSLRTSMTPVRVTKAMWTLSILVLINFIAEPVIGFFSGNMGFGTFILYLARAVLLAGCMTAGLWLQNVCARFRSPRTNILTMSLVGTIVVIILPWLYDFPRFTFSWIASIAFGLLAASIALIIYGPIWRKLGKNPSLYQKSE